MSICRQIRLVLWKNFTIRRRRWSYQSETNIKESFCINEQFNQTFLINRLQSIETKNFLCNNLSIIDLKFFLINTNMELNIGLTGLQIMEVVQNIRSQLEILNNDFSFEGSNNWSRIESNI
ncbi:unnamed protein product [Rotaria sordida]|uniref:Uncharacterized protein n=1 Tax=Rotaria sordida TaxID=392033 RepID=A0A815G5Q2_9BILA|nr:unnamed protein product [Rotaria sordida]CAF1593413.1 unnamed protein product [Rotaria sordida]